MDGLHLGIELSPIPGRWNDGSLSVGLQAGRDDLVLGKALGGGLRFDVDVNVVAAPDGSPDFRGPLVHGKRGERFLYVTWGTLESGKHVMFRRLKLYLSALERAAWNQPGITWDDISAQAVELAVSGRGTDGTPACGTSRADWRPSPIAAR